MKYKLLVGFAGSHGIANALDSLVDAAGLVRDEDAIGFVLVGKGDEKPQLIRKSRGMGLENVLFLEEIEKAMVPSFLESMDVLYIGLRNHPLFRFGVSPNKLFDYMMSGKPIIYAINSGNDPVDDAKCGVSCEPENPAAVVKAIIKIKEMPDESRLAMGEAGCNYVQKHHDYSVLARNYLEAVQ
jgi:glycosyltransferase involved in cell wall biosynthesis